MKRKSFIISAATVAIGVPLVYYYRNNHNYNPLYTPGLLSTFCSERTLKEIGVEYRKLVPHENEVQKLKTILLTDQSGKKIKNSDKDGIAKLINDKMHDEFINAKVLIINDWVISITEARQCALISFS